MDKKEYILKILDATMDYFPLARGLKILISGEALDETAMDTLIAIFDKAIEDINDAQAKEKLQKSKEFLQKLKKIELDSQQNDQQSIKILDDMLQSI